MSPNYVVIISTAARNDLADILATEDRWSWSERQAYVVRLYQAIDSLHRFPLRHRERPAGKAKVRTMQIGAHTVMYAANPDTLVVDVLAVRRSTSDWERSGLR